jgi:flagellar M-ring protein FliF
MEEIKKNLVALWKGLSAQRKLSLIASFLLSLAVLSGVVYFASKPKLTLLYANMQPAEAAKVVEYLETKKITYDVSDGGKTVMVPASQVYSVRMGLASQGIPTMSDGGVGFELFDKPTFGMSDFMQRANYYRALQGELSRTIRQLDEVANARVLIVVPEDKLFGQDHQVAKASVFIQLQPGKSLDDSQVRAIRFLVANGVEGLQPERVAVVDSSGRAMAGSDDSTGGDDSGQTTDKQRQARAQLESYLQDKAQSMLDQVLGPGQAVVRVASELDYSQVQETSEKYDPKNSVPQTETAITETSTTHTADNNNGATGVTANAGQTNDNSKTNEQKKENTSTQYQIGKDVQVRTDAVGAIKRLTVALMLNEKKPATPGGKAVPRTPQEITQLENIVKAAVGFTTNDTRQDMIQSQEVPFADLFADTAAPAPKSTMTAQLDSYLPYITQGCLGLLAVGILLYFRSVFLSPVKNAGDAPDSFEALLHNYAISSNGHANGHVNGNGNGNGHAPRPAGNPSILTPAELSRLIRENPDNASHALRQWLKRN